MRIPDMIGNGRPVFSVEFFPPKTDEGRENLLATARATLGSLGRVVRVTRVFGVVNATPEFAEHTAVVDAASDVFVEAFGDAGRHTRLAVGVSSLPANLVLEIEAHVIVVPETKISSP